MKILPMPDTGYVHKDNILNFDYFPFEWFFKLMDSFVFLTIDWYSGINSIWQFKHWAIVWYIIIIIINWEKKKLTVWIDRIVKNAWTTYIENDKITNPWPFWWSCIEIIIQYYHYNNIIIIIDVGIGLEWMDGWINCIYRD